MKVRGLDGRDYSWRPKSRPSKRISQGHLRCRKLLASLFPLDSRLEEVSLPGSKGLTADFVLPHRKLVVEVHGRQHYEYVEHFHRNGLGFLDAQHRDRNKQRWAELNGFTYVDLPDDEDDGEWTKRIFG